jgi:hypothetical protein
MIVAIAPEMLDRALFAFNNALNKKVKVFIVVIF